MAENDSYRFSLGLYSHQHSKLGIMYECNEIRHRLPDVGENVIVQELCVLSKPNNTRKKKKNKENVYTVYRTREDCLDPYGKPKIFTVVGYTKPKEQALDRDCYILLRYQSPYNHDYILDWRIHAIYVATGSTKLEKVDKKS